MELQKVESSNIAEVGYDAISGRLRVRFISSGGLYEYDNVPQNVAEDFLQAKSKGRFFYKNIRHQHIGKKIDEAKEDEAANDADGSTQDEKPEPQRKKRAAKKASKRRWGEEHGDKDGETGSL